MLRKDPNQTPLLEALIAYRERTKAGFHVPGHKSGKGLQQTAAAYFQDMMKIDLTEVTGLDDLHDPEGAIRDAQRLAAGCFGAEETFFLVNGSTVGNLAGILALCEQGDTIIVQRNVHKSVIHGLMLAGARAVFLLPRVDLRSGIATGVSVQDVERALERYPEAKGVLLTNPNYYGMGIDLEPIVRLVHSYGKPLLIDEAHGAHYGFHPSLPKSALASGADLVVQSTHKMLTAMTMGAMLHVQGPHIDRGRLKQRLSMLQSSSPSYPIMASLDASRRLLQTEGSLWIERSLAIVDYFADELHSRPWYGLIREPAAEGYETRDPYKIVLSDATGTLNGFQLKDELESRGIMIEMADPRHVLLVFSLASQIEDAEMLLQTLDQIAQSTGINKGSESTRFERRQHDVELPPLFPENAAAPVSFHMKSGMQTKSIRLEEAEGKSCAEMIIPYPPGIPVLYPGETVTTPILRYIQKLIGVGARFQGAADSSLRTISVFVPDSAGKRSPCIE